LADLVYYNYSLNKQKTLNTMLIINSECFYSDNRYRFFLIVAEIIKYKTDVGTEIAKNIIKEICLNVNNFFTINSILHMSKIDCSAIITFIYALIGYNSLANDFLDALLEDYFIR